ncbi:Acetyltransferase (GNAT) domain-containing protein [Sporobacter termitidis DSM 10068]|uniref:Acetyltransferase (GNAT) domain-containing protein n=1 Tax=Sporobacter termitidis DSM 10068 TaxID=1123282 RepID=A0A1M5YGT5_9FIRM|nr:GNAT family N-acetyltransferase [Sporobacter termitidis]SHI11281.1 Acetyltransferase (GNAT) domain-containing protein [Sporobacter termitidis DSM 10068]
MELRFAAPDDIEELIRLRLDFFAEEPDLTPDEVQAAAIASELRGYFRRQLNRDFYAALAVSGGRAAAVSFLVVHRKPANVRFPTGKTGEILNVYTRPPYREKGLATAALKLLIEKAKEEGLSFIALSATAAGKPVYERLGFTENSPQDYTEMTLRLS